MHAQPAPWLNRVSRTSSRIVSDIAASIRPPTRYAAPMPTRDVTIDGTRDPLPGYLAAPDAWPPGPAIVVVQEWWGVDDHIRDVVRRVAAEGYAALAPDLYRGRQTAEPDEARKLAMELDADTAEADLKAAVTWLLENGATRVGAIGFCLGGAMVWRLAFHDDRLAAAAPFYGTAKSPGTLRCPVLGHFGGADRSISAEEIDALERHLEGQPLDHEIFVYDGAGHAFMNDTRHSFHPEAARLAWRRTFDFFDRHLRPS